MKRRLFNAGALGPPLLIACVALVLLLAAAWFTTLAVSFTYTWVRIPGTVNAEYVRLGLVDGCLMVYTHNLAEGGDAGFANGWEVRSRSQAPVLLPVHSGWAGWWELWIPLWIPTVAFGAVFCFVVRWSRNRREGTCPSCGYDLRGTPSGGGSECPECGAAAGKGEAKA